MKVNLPFAFSHFNFLAENGLLDVLLSSDSFLAGFNADSTKLQDATPLSYCATKFSIMLLERGLVLALGVAAANKLASVVLQLLSGVMSVLLPNVVLLHVMLVVL